jgi:hypothetical protein
MSDGSSKPVAVLALGGPRHGQGHTLDEWGEALRADAVVGRRLAHYAEPTQPLAPIHGAMPVVFRAGKAVSLDSEYKVLVAYWCPPPGGQA